MRLVHVDAGVRVEVSLLQRLAQQDAVRHVFDKRFFAVLVGLVFEADGVPHLLSHLAAHLLRNPFRNSHGGPLAATVTRNWKFLGVPAVHQSATRTTLNWVLRENSIYGHKFHFFPETDWPLTPTALKLRVKHTHDKLMTT